MKKFFKKFFLLLLFFALLFILYRALLIIPEAHFAVVKSKNFTLSKKIYKNKFNLVWQKILPENIEISILPLEKQFYRKNFIKKIVLFNNEIDKIEITLELYWQVKEEKIIEAGLRFQNKKEVEERISQIVYNSFNQIIDGTIRDNGDLKDALSKIELLFYKELNSDMTEFNFSEPKVIFISVPYYLNFKNLYNFSNEILEFEVMKKYINENPNFLRYLILKRINDKTVINIFMNPEDFYEGTNRKSNK